MRSRRCVSLYGGPTNTSPAGIKASVDRTRTCSVSRDPRNLRHRFRNSPGSHQRWVGDNCWILRCDKSSPPVLVSLTDGQLSNIVGAVIEDAEDLTPRSLTKTLLSAPPSDRFDFLVTSSISGRVSSSSLHPSESSTHRTLIQAPPHPLGLPEAGRQTPRQESIVRLLLR